MGNFISLTPGTLKSTVIDWVPCMLSDNAALPFKQVEVAESLTQLNKYKSKTCVFTPTQSLLAV